MDAPSRLAGNYINLSILHRQAGRLDSAHHWALQGYQTAWRSARERQKCQALQQLAEIFSKRGLRRRAIDTAKSAMQLAMQLGMLQQQSGLAALLHQQYAALGQYQEAYRYHKRLLALQDSLFNEQKSREIGRMEARLAFERERRKIEAEKKVLQKEKALQEAQLSRQYIVTTAVSIGMVLLLVLALILVRYYRREKQINALLNHQKEEIAAQRDQLDEAYHRLQELTRFKNSMMSMIVHDLKNPLGSIVLMAESRKAEALVQIKQSCQYMMHMVRNILDVQRAEETGFELQKEYLDARELIDRALEQVRLDAEGKSLRLQNDAPEDVVLYADDDGIFRVLVNLLTNALKYTPEEGRITVGLSVGEDSGDRLFWVKDTGAGIEAKHLQTIFYAYETGPVRSTGLGLTFCKMMVEAHGGMIGVESKPGHGSRFWFQIPRAKQKTAAGI
jgi:signal transduction histidine kinase